MHAGGAAVEDAERPVADLPAVAERAVEHRPPEAFGQAGDVGVAVVHAGGEQDPARHDAGAVGQVEHEPRLAAAAVHHLAGAHLDARVAGQLGAAIRVEVGRRPAVVAEEAADAVGHAVALPAGVEHQRAAARPAEHQGGAEAGGPTADDDAVPGWATGMPAPTSVGAVESVARVGALGSIAMHMTGR